MGVLEMIDMDSYRAEKQAMRELVLEDEDAEIDPVPGDGAGGRPEPELDRLSNIIAEFNDVFGGIEWENEDRVRRMITSDIPAGVVFEQTYGPGSAT